MRTVKWTMKWFLAALFIFAGVNHFVQPVFFVRIVPRYLPWQLELVYLSGLFEIVLGLALLVPQTSRWAAWGLIALLVAVFPANVHMAMNPHLFPELPPLALWLRLPVQGLLIAWAYWFTKR